MAQSRRNTRPPLARERAFGIVRSSACAGVSTPCLVFLRGYRVCLGPPPGRSVKDTCSLTRRECPDPDWLASSSAYAAIEMLSGMQEESERSRVYHLPFSRDAASVVSRFMWKQLNELRVKAVVRSFEVRCIPSIPTRALRLRDSSG